MFNKLFISLAVLTLLPFIVSLAGDNDTYAKDIGIKSLKLCVKRIQMLT